MSAGLRIVSLLPSATEMVCALGFGDRLVGRSHECDFPAGIEKLPVCTAPRFACDGSSREIDDRVRDLLADALSLYEVDEARLAELVPDVIVTQSQCEVCAVSLADVEAAVSERLGTGARVVSLEATTLAGIWQDIRRLAEALDVAHRGTELVERLQARVDAVSERGAAAPRRPRVLCVEWLDPLMVAGNWMPELVEAAGGTPAIASPRSDSSYVEWDRVVEDDPDVIVLLPCGFDMERTLAEADAITSRQGWQGLRAVADGRVYVTDGNQYFNRPGPRIVDSVELLAELVHPDLFTFGYRDRAWKPL